MITLITLDSLKTMQSPEMSTSVLDELSVVNMCLNEFPDESIARDNLICLSPSFNDRIPNYPSTRMNNPSKV